MILRPYQRDAVQAVYDAWDSGIKRPALVLPTAGGKTIIFSSICSVAVREEKRRPLILVHREELVFQTVAKLKAIDPHLAVGVVKAEQHEMNADVVVASIQSISRRLGVGSRAIASDRFDLVIVDEAHHASATTWLATLEHFGAMNPESDTVCLGVSATLARSDGVPLGHIWEEVCFEYSAHDAITDGYLARPVAQRVVLEDLNLKGVKIKAGDFSEADLGKRMYRSGQQIGAAVLQYGLDDTGRPRRGITFAPTVECAQQWAMDFNALGIRSEVVIGSTPTEQRQRSYQGITDRRIDMLVGCMVMTEGFDLPAAELVVMGRPTKSMPLYIQMIGRGLRLSPETGKRDCLILDVCGTIQDKITTLIDLDIPDICDCGCDCEFEHLCVLRCQCPRTKSGKLKRPCVVCRKNGAVGKCLHYERKHVVGCEHHCEGIGKPGEWDEDPAEDVILDAAGNPIEWVVDHSEVRLKQVDLFDATGRSIAKPKQKRRSGWALTNGGIPFLHTSTTFTDLIFLWPDNGAWTVGVKPKQGAARRVHEAGTFAEAVKVAESLHPRGGRPPSPLVGPATEGQIQTMQRFGLPVPPGLSKADASIALNTCFASKALD